MSIEQCQAQLCGSVEIRGRGSELVLLETSERLRSRVINVEVAQCECRAVRAGDDKPG